MNKKKEKWMFNLKNANKLLINTKKIKKKWIKMILLKYK